MSRELRVVVVEDEPLTRDAHLRFVQQVPGFEAAGSAATAAEALRAVSSLRREGRPADLLLLDVNLPDATGIDVARRLRAAGEDVDILAVTAHRDVETVRAAASLGVVGYLVKPFTREQLLHRLAAYQQYRTCGESSRSIRRRSIEHSMGFGHSQPRAAPRACPLRRWSAWPRSWRPCRGSRRPRSRRGRASPA